MARFRIYSPTLGVREDFSVILLNKAITPELSNVQSWNGEMRKAKLRAPELIRTSYLINSSDAVNTSVNLSTSGHAAEFASGDSLVMYITSGDNSGNNTSRTVVSANDDGATTKIFFVEEVTGVEVGQYLANAINVPDTDPSSNDFLKVATPDGFEVIRSHRFITSNETERLVAFTKEHIYFWNTTLTRWSILYTSSLDTTTYWDCDEYGDYLVATNGIDRPIQWDGNWQRALSQ